MRTPLLTTAFALAWIGMSGSGVADVHYFDKGEVPTEAPFELYSENAYTEPRSLKLSFAGSTGVETLPVSPLKLESRLIGVSFNYFTTPSTTTTILRVVFQDADGKEVAALEQQVPVAQHWNRVERVLAVPPNAAIKQVALQFKYRNQKEGAAVVLDNVRMESLKKSEDFQQGAFSLDSFDEWKRDTFAHERLLFGQGGRQLFDWQKSRFGESCAELTGAGEKELFQYPLKIADLKVSPEKSYTLSFFYQTSAGFKPNSALVMATFYDANGKALKERPRLLLGQADDWQEARFDVIPPAGVESMDLSFRLARVSPDIHVLVNKISFAEGSPQVHLKTSIDSDKKMLSGQVSSVMAPEESAIACHLLNGKGETVASPKIDAEGNFTIDLASLPDEKFEVVAVMSWAEGESRDSSTFHNYNSYPWENSLGILNASDSPPYPWTDLKYDAGQRKVATWNPSLAFSENGGLEQVTMQQPSEKLLKSPVRMMINGHDLFTATTPEGTLEVQDSPNRVAFSRKLKGDGFVANLQVRAEFDGMVKYTLQIEATRDLTLEEMDLIYEPAITDGLICADGGWINHRVVDLKKEKKVEASRFFPMIWVGRQDAGLYVCTETLYPQVEVQETEVHTLNYDGTFTTRFVNRPLELKQGETHLVEYAIGVTPFRPRTNDTPQWRFRAGKYSTGDLLWPKREVHPLFGFPKAPENKEVITEWLEKGNNPNVRKFNYQIPYFAMKNLPQYAYFEKAWYTDPAMVYTAENTRYDYDLLRLNVAQKTWQDIYLKAFKEYFTEYPFDGVYYDCVSFHQNKQPGGTLRYRLFALREYLQRIYVLQRQINPKTWTFAHSGASISDFNAVFSDIILTGEHYRGPLRKHRFYLEFLTLEEFRIHNCTEFGPLRMFLPQFSGEKATAPDVTTHTLGMVLLHDLYLYPNFVNKEITDASRNRHYAFYDSGENNRFRSYWGEDAYPSGNEAVKCSVYENSKGALRIYLNTTGEAQNVKLTDVPEGSVVTVFDPLLQRSSTAVTGDDLPLEPYMMKMVLAAPAEIWSDL